MGVTLVPADEDERQLLHQVKAIAVLRGMSVDRGHHPWFKAWAGASILSVLRLLLLLVIVGGLLLLGLFLFAVVLVKGLLIPLVLIVGTILLVRHLWRRCQDGRSGNTSAPGGPASRK